MKPTIDTRDHVVYRLMDSQVSAEERPVFLFWSFFFQKNTSNFTRKSTRSKNKSLLALQPACNLTNMSYICAKSTASENT